MHSFKENSMDWKQKHWTKEVQRALTIPPSSKGGAKKRMVEIPALNHLCEKAPKWIQHFPEIRKLEKKLEKLNDLMLECSWGHDKDEEEEKDDNEDEEKDDNEDEDEDEEDEDEFWEKKQRLKQMLMEKSLLLAEAKRLIKIMIEIAVDLRNYFSEFIQGLFYDIEERPICRRLCGSRFYVEKGKHLSDAQLNLSTFAHIFAHPSPEELGISSQNC